MLYQMVTPCVMKQVIVCTVAFINLTGYRPQANLCSVQVGSSYRGTKIYLHKLVHGSELILKLKVLHLFCSHFREFLH